MGQSRKRKSPSSRHSWLLLAAMGIAAATMIALAVYSLDLTQLRTALIGLSPSSTNQDWDIDIDDPAPQTDGALPATNCSPSAAPSPSATATPQLFPLSLANPLSLHPAQAQSPMILLCGNGHVGDTPSPYQAEDELIVEKPLVNQKKQYGADNIASILCRGTDMNGNIVNPGMCASKFPGRRVGGCTTITDGVTPLGSPRLQAIITLSDVGGSTLYHLTEGQISHPANYDDETKYDAVHPIADADPVSDIMPVEHRISTWALDQADEALINKKNKSWLPFLKRTLAMTKRHEMRHVCIHREAVARWRRLNNRPPVPDNPSGWSSKAALISDVTQAYIDEFYKIKSENDQVHDLYDQATSLSSNLSWNTITPNSGSSFGCPYSTRDQEKKIVAAIRSAYNNLQWAPAFEGDCDDLMDPNGNWAS